MAALDPEPDGARAIAPGQDADGEFDSVLHDRQAGITRLIAEGNSVAGKVTAEGQWVVIGTTRQLLPSGLR